MNEVLTQKVVSLQRCVARARQARREAGDQFSADFNLQDAAVLNVIRACELAIDLANMLVRQRKFGVPSESRESFAILKREGLIDAALGDRLIRMVGFRNVAIHQYRDLVPEIVESVIEKDLDDLLMFGDFMRLALTSDET